MGDLFPATEMTLIDRLRAWESDGFPIAGEAAKTILDLQEGISELESKRNQLIRESESRIEELEQIAKAVPVCDNCGGDLPSIVLCNECTEKGVKF